MNSTAKSQSPFAGVTWYHWLVVIIASCGWLFDCMDQRLFILARSWALQSVMEEHLVEGLPSWIDEDLNWTADQKAALPKIESMDQVRLLPAEQQSYIMKLVKNEVNWYGGVATTSMIIGWATGGIIFGMMSDKIGRVKTMTATLLTYSVFTGLSGASHTWIDFVIYRFLVGLGVGGMFGAATALVAESVPPAFRALALGSLQALSATGNIMGSLISLGVPPGSQDVLLGFEGWRILFFVGILPAILIIPIITVLREPQSWVEAKKRAQSGEPAHQMGTVADLFKHPRWRHHTIIGIMFGISGMAGLWGIGFFSPELIENALSALPQVEVDRVRSIGTALQDVGSFCGMMAVTFIAAYLGRRLAFLFAFSLSLVITIFVFLSLNQPSDAYWMLPMMGFAQLAVFGCYSIYYPELYPTRLRGTGVGFCYNTVRYLAAPFPILMMNLRTLLQDNGVEHPFRMAAVMMSFIYVIGIVALIWAPETKGQPLPEDD